MAECCIYSGLLQHFFVNVWLKQSQIFRFSWPLVFIPWGHEDLRLYWSQRSRLTSGGDEADANTHIYAHKCSARDEMQPPTPTSGVSSSGEIPHSAAQACTRSTDQVTMVIDPGGICPPACVFWDELKLPYQFLCSSSLHLLPIFPLSLILAHTSKHTHTLPGFILLYLVFYITWKVIWCLWAGRFPFCYVIA